MGKRRALLSHGPDRRGLDDDDDEDENEEEENLEKEPLKPEQVAEIQTRKKLIAKRRTNDSSASNGGSFTPFSSLSSSLTAKPAGQVSFNDKTEQSTTSVFAGFKGFSNLKPSIATSSSILQTNGASINTASASKTPTETNIASNILNKTDNKSDSVTSNINGGFSFLNNNTNKLSTPSSKTTNGTSLVDNINNNKTASLVTSATESDTKNNSKSKHINEKELIFINELKDLYEKCYGGSNRSFKLPLNSSKEADSKEDSKETDNETNYACLLAELNKKVAKWIHKHVEENPLVILTPIFVDYFQYLILLEKEYFPSSFEITEKKSTNVTSESTPVVITLNGTHATNGNHINGKSTTTTKEIDVSEKVENEVSNNNNKILSDSSKTFASLINTTQQSTFGQINLFSNNTNNSKANIPTDSNINSTSNTGGLFSFKSSNSNETGNGLNEKANLFKFGSNNSISSSTSTSSISTITSTSSTLSSSQSTTANESPLKVKSDFFSNSVKNATASIASTNSADTAEKEPTKLIFFSNLQNKTSETPQSNTFSSNTSQTISWTTPINDPSSLSNIKPYFSFGNTKPASAKTPALQTTDKNKTDASVNSSTLTTVTPLASASKEGEISSTDSNSIFKPFNSFASTPATSLFKPSISSSTTTGTEKVTPTTKAGEFFAFPSTVIGNKPSALFGSSVPFGSGSSEPATTSFNTPGTSIFGSGGSSFGSTFGSGGIKPFGSGGGDGGGEADDEPYEPPKPETSDVKEEGSVYTKRVKLYYFNEKEGKFCDRGVGNLFLKPINNGDNTQLIVRADTSLAQILLNVKLNKMFPVNKSGQKDVSYMCVPNPPIPSTTPNAPCKFLFRVKTEDDAKELLEKLNEYKK